MNACRRLAPSAGSIVFFTVGNEMGFESAIVRAKISELSHVRSENYGFIWSAFAGIHVLCLHLRSQSIAKI